MLVSVIQSRKCFQFLINLDDILNEYTLGLGIINIRNSIDFQSMRKRNL